MKHLKEKRGDYVSLAKRVRDHKAAAAQKRNATQGPQIGVNQELDCLFENLDEEMEDIEKAKMELHAAKQYLGYHTLLTAGQGGNQ